MTLANLITLGRLPLLFLVVGLLSVPSWRVQCLNMGLLAVLFLMDWWDGLAARRRGEVSQLGAVLDVALDRAVENILWVAFLALDLVPLWVPVVFLTRAFVVDGIRGAALARGKSVFGMMHTPLGKFLVASRLMRVFYGVAKSSAFGMLLLTHALALKDPAWRVALAPVVQGLIFVSVALCLIRGLPVILDGRRYFSKGD
jgi:CDP-diacylglycerol--glycerol-3-phosphate 3-phosphatidyltransferase